MGDFESLRGAVATGDGIVARFPGIVCVADGAGADEAHLRRLLEICREVSGSAPGRPLAKRLAAWLSAGDGPADTPLRFGTVAATGEDGLAVFCVGAVSMIAPEVGITICGTDSAAWADRLLPRPDSPVLLTLDGAVVPTELPSSVHDLRHGVVPGAAVALLASEAAALASVPPAAAAPSMTSAAEVPAPAPAPAGPAGPAEPPGAPAPAAPEPPTPAARTELATPKAVAPVSEETVIAPPAPGIPPADEPPTQLLREPPVSDQGPVPRAPRRSEPIIGVPVEARPPLPVGGGIAGPADESPTSISTPQARGHLCKNGHLNDPRSHFCVLCGIRMTQETGKVVIGTRPPLGLLVFDDSSTYTVDADYCIGRMPEVNPRVADGSLRAIAIEDGSGSVSRAHAEIRLQDWDVLLTDSGSSNGTQVAGPGEENWTQLRPGEIRRLEPGTRVRLGARTFVFESPGGVR